MLNARSSTANRTTAGRWTVAAALLASAVTVLAACSGGATGGSAPESSAPVIRGTVGNVVACTPTSTVICAVAGANANEVNVSWIGTGTGFIVQYQKPGSSGYRNPAGSCANATTYLSAALQCTATSVPTGTNKFRVAPYRNGGAGTYSSWKSVTVIGAPGAPVIGAATVTGATTATVAFTAPTSNGGAAIMSYTATSSPGGITGTLTQSDSGAIPVSGLTVGVKYTFTVTATNAVGTSVASAPSGEITTIELPSPPSNVAATTGPVTEAGLATATVTFDASTSTGGSSISQYKATSSPDGLTGVRNMPGAGSITVTGLTPGTAYTFTVTATNVAGATSFASAPSGPVTAAYEVTATAGSNSGQVVVTWSPRGTNSNIGFFVYQRQTGAAWSAGLGGCSAGSTQTSNAAQCTASNLTPGAEYQFRVQNRPYYSFGTYKYSNKVTLPATPATSSGAGTSSSDTTVPGAPEIYTVTNTRGKALVFFNVPTSDGGTTITGYNVSWSPSVAGSTATCTTTCIVEGLMGGISYTFQMTATNTKGDSAPSAGYLHLFKGLPAAPEIANVVQGSAGTGTATISFIPGLEGGGTVSGYTLMSTPGDKSVTVGASAGTVTVTGLTVGTQYTFTMKATNEYGDSVNSAARTFTAS